MLREYFNWWVGQMHDLVPAGLREAFVEHADALLIEPSGGSIENPDAIAIGLVKDRQQSDLGRYACTDSGLEAGGRTIKALGRAPAARLRLSTDVMLAKTVTLPMAAERELRTVLQYEMDRHTPFSADEVWWNFAVRQRDRVRGKLTVQLWLIPRNVVAPLLTTLTAHGLQISAIDIADVDRSRVSIPLQKTMNGQRSWRGRAVPMAAIGCAALALVALVLPFVRQSYQEGAAARRIAALKPAVDEADALRRRLNGGGAADALAAERARVGDPLAVLAAATRIMPDDTYLTDITMQQRRLTLNGQAVGPAKLIPALANDPTFQDPALGTSTHAEGSRTDVFSITAQARP